MNKEEEEQFVGGLLVLGVGFVVIVLVVLLFNWMYAQEDEKCAELQQWYRDNPGDTNPAIRRDYNYYCN